MTKQIKIFIEPYLMPSKEKSLPVLINQLLTSMNKIQATQIRNSLENSWKIRIEQDKYPSETHIYTPVQGLLNFINKINNFPQNPIAKPQFDNLFEETKTFILKKICKIQISWDGIINISTYDKKSEYNFYIQTTQQVIIENLYAKDLTITAPYTSIRSYNRAKTITFSIDRTQNNEQTKMPILEIIPKSYLQADILQVDGLLLNKGDLQMYFDSKITAISLSNLGSINGQINLKCDTQNFNNYGKIESHNVIIKSNTFYQIPIEANIHSSIKADKLNIETSEEVKIKNGYIDAKEFKLTSLGLVENTVNINSEIINFNIQSTFLNRGNFHSNSVQISTFGSVYNTGKIRAKEEIKINLNNNDGTFYQEGNIESDRLEINAVLKNNGFISAKHLVWKGNHSSSENYGEMNISDEAQVDILIIDQRGKLFVRNMKGNVLVWNNYSVSSISSDEKVDSLLINNLHAYNESRFNLLGSLDAYEFINEGLFFIKGFLFSSICKNEEEGEVVLEEHEDPRNYPDFIVTASKKCGIILYKLKSNEKIYPFKFENKGKIISKYGLLLSDFNFADSGTFLIEGDLTVTNEKLYGRNPYDKKLQLKQIYVSGSITIIDRFLNLTIDDEIDRDCLKFIVKNYIQKVKVIARNIEIGSEKASIEDTIYSDEKLKIQSKELTNNSKIKSSKSLLLEFDHFKNNGEIETDSLDFKGKKVDNKGKIVCLNGRVFHISSYFYMSNTSFILLNNQDIKLPNKIEFEGIFEANNSNINSKQSYLKYFDYSILNNSKLVLKNSELNCATLKNYGEFEINNSKVHAKRIYTTYDHSLTSFYGNFSLNALTLDLHGITKTDTSIKVTFGENPSYVGGFESYKKLILQNPSNFTKNNFVSNLVRIVNGSETKRKYIHEDQIVAGNSFYSISNSDLDYTFYEVIIITEYLEFFDVNIASAKKIKIKADTFNNFSSDIQTEKLSIRSKQVHNKSGFIYSLSSLEIKATNLINANGKIGAEDYVHINVENDLANNGLIFSKNNYLEINSGHNIDNSYSTIYSKGNIYIYCKNILINSSGLLLSLDPEMTSIIQTSFLVNSIFTKEFTNIYKYLCFTLIEKHDKATSHSGKIIIAGNCKLTGEVHNNGSLICVGKTLFNKKDEYLLFVSNEVDNYRGYIIANKASLFVDEFKSNGSKALFGPGGLKIESKSSISFNDSFYDYMPSGNVFDPLDIACNYPSLFCKCDNGVIDICLPLRNNKMSSSWNSNKQNKNELFMMTPDALKLALSLFPMQIHSVWETDIESLICNQHEEIKSNRILSVKQAKKLNKLSISWITESKNKKNVVKLYPFIVIPNKYIKTDVYSIGTINIYSKNSIKFGNADVCCEDKIDMESSKLIAQKGGMLYSGDKLSIISKDIYHEPYIKINNILTYLLTSDGGYDYYHPCIKANEFYEHGNVHGKAVKCKVKKYNQDGGTLKMEPDIITKVTYSSSKKDNIKSEVKKTTQTVIPSQIIAEEAHFHCSTELKGAIAYIKDIYKYSDLSITSQVVTDSYEAKAKKSGLFSRSKIESTGHHQKSFPTYLKGNNLIDMTEDVNKGLLMRSSILDVLNVELTSNIKQQTDFLKHYDHTKTTTVGITLPWFDDPRPSLIHSIDSLIDASNIADRTVSGIQTVTNSLRLVNDAAHVALEGGPYVSNILQNFASKIATFSIGMTEENQSNSRYQPVLNDISCNNLKVRNNETEIRGSIKSNKIDIDTEKLLIEAPISVSREKIECENKSISISPLQAKITNPAGLLPTVSWGESTTEKITKMATKAEVEAEEIKIKSDYMHVKGANVSADKLHVKVEKDLIVESIEDEVVEEGDDFSVSISLGGLGSALKSAASAAPSTCLDSALKAINKTPLSLSPTVRYSDHKNVDKDVVIEASLVGKKECDISVGRQLIRKSSKVGKLTNGEVTDEGVYAPKIVDEMIQSTKTNENNTYVVPIGDAIALLSAANDLAQIRHIFFQALQNKEKDDKVAMEKLNSKEIQEILGIIIDFANEEANLDENREQKSDQQDDTQSAKTNDKKITDNDKPQKDGKNGQQNNAKSTGNSQQSNTENTENSQQNNAKSTGNSQQNNAKSTGNSQQNNAKSSESSQQNNTENTENGQQVEFSDDYLNGIDLENPEEVNRLKKLIFEKYMQGKSTQMSTYSYNGEPVQIDNLVFELFDFSKPESMATPCLFNRNFWVEDYPEDTENMDERIAKIFRGAVKDYYDNNVSKYWKKHHFEFFRRNRMIFKRNLPKLYELYDKMFPCYNEVFFKSIDGKIDRDSLPPEIRNDSVYLLRGRHRQLHRYFYEYIDRQMEEEIQLQEILESKIPLRKKLKIVNKYEMRIKERSERERREYESLGFKLVLTNQFNKEVNASGPCQEYP